MKNVPRLRFPGFTDIWENKRLKDVTTINPTNRSLPDSFVYIDLESVTNGVLSKEQTVEKIEAPSRAQRLLSKDDILFQMVRPYQMNNYYFDLIGEYVASTGYAQIRTAESSKFVFQYLHYKDFVDDVIEKCTGSNYPAINSGDLANIRISLPTIEEQNKISAFLWAADDKLNQLKKKKALLEKYKKGMMQKIFNQEVRFKDEDGGNFGEWEEMPMNKIFQRKITKNKDGLIKTVLTNSALRGIVLQQDYFDKEIANVDSIKTYYVVNEDDFVYNPRISEYAPVGPFKRNKLVQGIMSPLYSIFSVSAGNLDFYQYYFETILWHDYMFAIANFGARHDRMNIRMSDFEELPLPFPDLKEQTKIANFLSAIDGKIRLVSTEVEKLEIWKKGLLGEMFV